ncbi:ketopantoate reductase family protein [Cohnella suwonensis]|uniref:2-dehydropantoate 2-reductase n=1 Tax=Cohnella suwonensis TaxID=696072 RepID=A0ABW0LZ44_9BACL
MKALIVGAGAIGGYVAARMLEAGAEVTLLARGKRKEQLEEHGLIVRSPSGDYEGRPSAIAWGEPAGPFDLAILATKAYGLDEALERLRPYLSERTAILPFLNGMKHMEQLAEAFPEQPLLGGVARIEITLDEDGAVRHLAPYHSFTYGRFRSFDDGHYAELRRMLSDIPLFSEKEDIESDMWEKYAFINVLSGLTTLFQAPVGDIRDAGAGMESFRRAFAETNAVIAAAGGRLDAGLPDKQLRIVAGMSRVSTTSMLRDMQNGLPTESAHLQGYMIELARSHGCDVPLLEIIRQRLEIYERNRA